MNRDQNSSSRTGSASSKNERSDLNAQATDKSKKTQKSGGSDWDRTDRKSSDM